MGQGAGRTVRSDLGCGVEGSESNFTHTNTHTHILAHFFHTRTQMHKHTVEGSGSNIFCFRSLDTGPKKVLDP